METIFINTKPEAKIASEIAAKFGYEFKPETFYKRETMNALNGLPEARQIGTVIASEISARRNRANASRKLAGTGTTSDAVLRIAETSGLPVGFVSSQMSNYDLARCDAAGVVASMKVDYEAATR